MLFLQSTKMAEAGTASYMLNMSVSNDMYTYTDSRGNKHEVPMVRASSLDQIKRGDHICFNRNLYWHHAIVETVDKLNGEVIVIEYSNTAKQFIQDNSIPPKNPGWAKVVRRSFKLENDPVYVIKHDSCYDPEEVVTRAKGKIGERDYNPITNNCEHFALWCKTGISSSEQVNSFGEFVMKKNADPSTYHFLL